MNSDHSDLKITVPLIHERKYHVDCDLISKTWPSWLFLSISEKIKIKFLFSGATFHSPLTIRSATLSRLLHCSLWGFSGALLIFQGSILHFRGEIACSLPHVFPPCCQSNTESMTVMNTPPFYTSMHFYNWWMLRMCSLFIKSHLMKTLHFNSNFN